MKTITLLRVLAKQFPKRIKDNQDHVGLMTGKLLDDTKCILLCLDFDEEVFSIVEGLERKPDLILTHHPFIYGTKYRVFKENEDKKALCDKIDRLGIPVYSMHTNFDTGKGGMNDALAEALKLKDIQPLQNNPMARGGLLPHEMTPEQFALYAKRALKANSCSLIDAGAKVIRSAAIIGGGGWYCFRDAQMSGYDIFISGDIPHHGRRDVIAKHYNYLDLPHEIERIFIPTMSKIIKSIDRSIEIIEIDHEKEPKRF
ncbi:MAG: Nif3-like dinuclear metal center hexameric protein [Bacilli bacterium]|jgi:dinuclear metal center YbgI/SA1388 family protein